MSLDETKSWIGRNKWWVALIIVVFAGYMVGKDRASRDNAHDAASLEHSGGQ